MVSRLPWAILSLFLLLVASHSTGVAYAHGEQVNLAVTCVTPDPRRPLTKVCTAFLKYLDGEPVSDASLALTAKREGDSRVTLGPVNFQPLNEKGLYSATAGFPAYGRWRIKITVQQPGVGDAELVEEILPPVSGASPDAPERLQLVFGFGPSDMRNIAVRLVHLLASIGWFGLSGLTLGLSLLRDFPQQRRLMGRLAKAFPWAAALIMLGLAISGALSARYSTPNGPPGLFALDAMARLPFGETYLIAFAVKMLLAVAMATSSVALAISLRKLYDSGIVVPDGTAEGVYSVNNPARQHVKRLAAINVVLPVLILGNVVILGYLHVISHVGAAVGAR